MKYTVILETYVRYEGGETHGPYHVTAENRQQAEDAALALHVEEYRAHYRSAHYEPDGPHYDGVSSYVFKGHIREV